MSARTAGQIITVVTVEAADEPSALAAGLAVVAEALRACAGQPERDHPIVLTPRLYWR